MIDIIAQIDAASSTGVGTKAAQTLIACRAEIISLREQIGGEWRTIDTLSFDHDYGSHRRAHKVWMCDATGVVRLGTPIKRTRDGLIGLFADTYFPTHWMPFVVPTAPAKEPA